jgi:hypothetical protein
VVLVVRGAGRASAGLRGCDASGFNGKGVTFPVYRNRQFWRSNYAATSAWTEMGNIWPRKIVPIGR